MRRSDSQHLQGRKDGSQYQATGNPWMRKTWAALNSKREIYTSLSRRTSPSLDF